MTAPYIPLVPSGRADDLLGILVRAEEVRYARLGIKMPEKPAGTRAWLEPLGNLFGRALYASFKVMPNRLLAAVQVGGWGKLAAPNTFPLDAADPRLAEARALIAAAGGRAALLCVFTHPPVVGEWLNLNIELTRQAMWALSFLRPRTPRPKLIVAVDAFALDGFGLFMEGAYAGFMGSLHLGFDRLAKHRGVVSRALVGFTAWDRILWRLARTLRTGGEAGLPLGGGIPTTSRALYSAKEFVWSCRRRRPRDRGAMAALRALEANGDFTAFLASGLVGPGLRRSAWRVFEAYLLAVTAGAWGGDDKRPGGPSADRGALTEPARAAALAVAMALGLSSADASDAASLLDRELARETPYRPRLFRILARRVAGKGTPLVLVPLAHGKPPDVRMCWGEPVAWVESRGEDVTALRVDGSRAREPIEKAARAFVEKNLP